MFNGTHFQKPPNYNKKVTNFTKNLKLYKGLHILIQTRAPTPTHPPLPSVTLIKAIVDPSLQSSIVFIPCSIYLSLISGNVCVQEVEEIFSSDDIESIHGALVSVAVTKRLKNNFKISRIERVR